MKKVYDIKRNNQFHFQQVCIIYSFRYLKYHNMLDLSILHYDEIPDYLRKGKIVELRRELINFQRIKVFIDWNINKDEENYYGDKIKEFMKSSFVFVNDPKDEEIGIAFINLFSHTKLAADFILRHVPILDILWIKMNRPI